MRRAAAYVRMSTDHQQYSIENQLQAINDYALAHEIQVVKVYSDPGRSGLTANRREALQQIISDVQTAQADFDVILVYDVSRWGRFQNVDESAFFEFVCTKAGVAIEYCAEEFRNDGSMIAAISKVLKRAMAAEYSRELSTKVTRSQARIAKMGYHLGGSAGFGLRRLMVDRTGSPKGILKDGEQKHLQTDRVILIPGPPTEMEIVRSIFKMFAHQHLSSRQIAKLLNGKGIRNNNGNLWTYQNVDWLLRSERYVGNNVYNRTSLKMQTRRIANPKVKWIRSDGVIEPIIDQELFAAARRRMRERRILCDNDLLDHLTAVWCKAGRISCQIMQTVPGTPRPHTYAQHFGSLDDAYRKIGYKRTHTYRSTVLNTVLHRTHRNTLAAIATEVQKQGGRFTIDNKSQLIQINDSVTISAIVLPFTNRADHGPCWRHYDRAAISDLLLLVRLTKSNEKALDYHLLPFHLVHGPTFNFTDQALASLARYRFKSLSGFHDALQACFGRHAG